MSHTKTHTTKERLNQHEKRIKQLEVTVLYLMEVMKANNLFKMAQEAQDKAKKEIE